MKKLLLLKLTLIFITLVSSAESKQINYHNKGKLLFENNQIEKSKILFERDIVFNPKNENSYLFLAKIFKKKNNEEEEEINLKSVLLLNPSNDEAIYMLTLLKIKQSDYKESKKLIEKFNLVCKSFCEKKKEMQEKFSKLNPNETEKEN